jgi:hypothetical protein
VCHALAHDAHATIRPADCSSPGAAAEALSSFAAAKAAAIVLAAVHFGGAAVLVGARRRDGVARAFFGRHRHHRAPTAPGVARRLEKLSSKHQAQSGID